MDFIKENLKEVTTPDKITDLVVFEKGSNVPKRIKSSNYNSDALVWKAVLNQTGTSAPTVNVVRNTLGVVTVTYDGVGSYIINSNGLFTVGKTVYYNSQNYTNLGNEITYLYPIDANSFGIETLDDNISANGILIDTCFVIEVYP